MKVDFIAENALNIQSILSGLLLPVGHGVCRKVPVKVKSRFPSRDKAVEKVM